MVLFIKKQYIVYRKVYFSVNFFANNYAGNYQDKANIYRQIIF